MFHGLIHSKDFIFHGVTWCSQLTKFKTFFIVTKFFIPLKSFYVLIHEIKNSNLFIFHGVTWHSQVKKLKIVMFLLKKRKFNIFHFIESLGTLSKKFRKIVLYIRLEKNLHD